jgi:hypothetical protein
MLIGILGSVPLTNGSGCGSDSGPRDPDPASDPALFACDLQDAKKKIFSTKFLNLFPFKGTFTSFFKDKKSKRKYKAVEIKIFFHCFAC